MLRPRVNLDFSLRSLVEDLELVLEHSELQQGCSVENQDYDFEACAGAYLGEVLLRAFQGSWEGHLDPTGARSYYTSWITFGEFELRPFSYIGYRHTNGLEDTGSVEQYLEELLPQIRDGRNYKRDLIRELTAEGRLVVDTRPWL